MPANATLALSAVSAALATLYSLPVYTAKRPVGAGKPPIGGWNPGWNATNGCFVVSAQEPEGVDDDGTFEEVSVRYAVTVEYVKPSHAKTAGGEDPALNEDSDVRDKRAGVRSLLYSPRVSGIADVANVSWRARPTYETAGTGGAPVVVSGQTAVYEVMEARPA